MISRIISATLSGRTWMLQKRYRINSRTAMPASNWACQILKTPQTECLICPQHSSGYPKWSGNYKLLQEHNKRCILLSKFGEVSCPRAILMINKSLTTRCCSWRIIERSTCDIRLSVSWYTVSTMDNRFYCYLLATFLLSRHSNSNFILVTLWQITVITKETRPV
mgnify:CR=1 FL=1